MFETLKQKIALAVFIILLISIPIGSYLLSQQQTIKTRASEGKKTATKSASLLESTASSSLSPLDEISDLVKALEEAETTPTPVTATSFGPTLGFKLTLEGRPAGRMASKVFVGITEGATAQGAPKYLLSFTIDLLDNGVFNNLSLAGLTPGNTYTAYIKPTVQLATSSAFIMSPTISYINSNQNMTLLTGDLNQDNVINSADYSIEKSLLGTNSASTNWNLDADFNLDGVVNIVDLSFISKNMAKTGDSGVWISTPATPSASLNSPIGGPTSHPTGSSGYWLWVP